MIADSDSMLLIDERGNRYSAKAGQENMFLWGFIL